MNPTRTLLAGTGSTLTTADIQTQALRRLQRLDHLATTYADAARREAGQHSKPWAGMIHCLGDQADAVRELAHLALEHGDADAWTSIGAAIQQTVARLIDLSYQARMASVPGWDPQAQGFRPAGDRAAPDTGPSIPTGEATELPLETVIVQAPR